MNTAIAKTRPENVTLFVGQLADNTKVEDIRALFSPYGTVSAIRLVPSTTDRGDEAFCYVEMTQRQAAAAITGLDGTVVAGSILRVREADTRTDRPAATRPTTDIERAAHSARFRYRVASVEKVATPDGAEGEDWYRYVLSSESSKITGFHRGSLAEVREYANRCVEQFNLRSIRGKSARTMALSKRS